VKITGKRCVKGKKIQLSSDDGRVFLVDKKNESSIGDTLKISLPEQKILETFALAKGNTAFVFKGKRIGAVAEIEQVLPGTMKRGKLVVLKPKEGEAFQTIAGNVFVAGKQKVEIDLD
jgi:small subunit ribosomal protein S4e